MGMDFAVQALAPYTPRTVAARPLTARLLRWTLTGPGALLLACVEAPVAGQDGPGAPVAADPALAAAAADCPAVGVAPIPLPRTRPEHESLAYWLERTQAVADVDRPILDAAAVRALNTAAHVNPALGFGGRADLRAPIDVAALASGLQARLGFLRERFTTGKYVRLDGAPLPAELQARYAAEVTPEALAQGLRAPTLPVRTGPKGHDPGDSFPELRVALDLVPIYCGPQTEPYYTTTRDPEFDRNLCSMARAQEVVQILRPWDGDLVLARTSYVVGWIDARAAALSPPLAPAEARAFLDGAGPAPVPVAASLAPGASARLTLDLAADSFLGLPWGPEAAKINRAFVDVPRRIAFDDAFTSARRGAFVYASAAVEVRLELP